MMDDDRFLWLCNGCGSELGCLKGVEIFLPGESGDISVCGAERIEKRCPICRYRNRMVATPGFGEVTKTCEP